MIQVILIFLLSLSFSRPAFADWTVWDTLGGGNYSTPSACTVGNWTYVFVLNSLKQVSFRKRWLPTGYWSPWRAVPDMRQGNRASSASGAPAAYCFQEGNSTRIALHVIGVDRRIWSTFTVVSPNSVDTWYNWNVNSGFTAALNSGLAIASLNGRRTHLFARGADNRIYVQILGTTSFQLLISEPTTHDFAAVWSSNDRLEFFYRDNSGQIWHQHKINNVWYLRQFIPTPPGERFGALAVVRRNSNTLDTLDLFTTAFDVTVGSRVYHKRFVNSRWSDWESLGGNIFYGPGATVYANSVRMMVFATSRSTGALIYRAWAP